jgi:hypothetical protein
MRPRAHTLCCSFFLCLHLSSFTCAARAARSTAALKSAVRSNAHAGGGPWALKAGAVGGMLCKWRGRALLPLFPAKEVCNIICFTALFVRAARKHSKRLPLSRTMPRGGPADDPPLTRMQVEEAFKKAER